MVLRPFERDQINRYQPRILAQDYRLAKIFDGTEAIRNATLVPIRGFLNYNAIFEIYKRNEPDSRPAGPFVPVQLPVALDDFITKNAAYAVELAGHAIKAHAPSQLVWPIPAGAKTFQGGFGIFEGAYQNPPDATDGADFIIDHVSVDGRHTTLLRRALDPVARREDRGLQHFNVTLPINSQGRLELTITTGAQGNGSFDWTYWQDLRVGFAIR